MVQYWYSNSLRSVLKNWRYTTGVAAGVPQEHNKRRVAH